MRLGLMLAVWLVPLMAAGQTTFFQQVQAERDIIANGYRDAEVFWNSATCYQNYIPRCDVLTEAEKQQGLQWCRDCLNKCNDGTEKLAAATNKLNGAVLAWNAGRQNDAVILLSEAKFARQDAQIALGTAKYYLLRLQELIL